jgi:small-conductance mechanosensitive channel
MLYDVFFALMIFAAFVAASFFFCHLLKEVSSRFDVSANEVFTMLANSQQAIMIFIGSVLALARLGFNVSALVAGLGLTGFALGFALKDAIANLVAGIMIVIYKPIELGSIVEISGTKGEVIDINLRYITIQKEDAVDLVPNSLFLSKQITVFKPSS